MGSSPPGEAKVRPSGTRSLSESGRGWKDATLSQAPSLLILVWAPPVLSLFLLSEHPQPGPDSDFSGFFFFSFSFK